MPMLSFNKSHGLGNDFIIIDDRKDGISDYASLARRLCDRFTGVGADGLLVLLESHVCNVRMRIFNSDGSEAQMCGNGIRCFAKYVYEKGIITQPEFSVETRGGVMRPRLNLNRGAVESVTVDMGTPMFGRASIPMLGKWRFLMQKIRVLNREFTVSSMFMTIPHTVVFVDDISSIDVGRYGPAIERHPLYPEGTNVNFVQVLDSGSIAARPWERGCGITLACGTGASASAVACALAGLTRRRVSVNLELGKLEILYSPSGRVYMTGPAENVFEGTIS